MSESTVPAKFHGILHRQASLRPHTAQVASARLGSAAAGFLANVRGRQVHRSGMLAQGGDHLARIRRSYHKMYTTIAGEYRRPMLRTRTLNHGGSSHWQPLDLVLAGSPAPREAQPAAVSGETGGRIRNTQSFSSGQAIPRMSDDPLAQMGKARKAAADARPKKPVVPATHRLFSRVMEVVPPKPDESLPAGLSDAALITPVSPSASLSTPAAPPVLPDPESKSSGRQIGPPALAVPPDSTAPRPAPAVQSPPAPQPAAPLSAPSAQALPVDTPPAQPAPTRPTLAERTGHARPIQHEQPLAAHAQPAEKTIPASAPADAPSLRSAVAPHPVQAGTVQRESAAPAPAAPAPRPAASKASVQPRRAVVKPAPQPNLPAPEIRHMPAQAVIAAPAQPPLSRPAEGALSAAEASIPPARPSAPHAPQPGPAASQPSALNQPARPAVQAAAQPAVQRPDQHLAQIMPVADRIAPAARSIAPAAVPAAAPAAAPAAESKPSPAPAAGLPTGQPALPPRESAALPPARPAPSQSEPPAPSEPAIDQTLPAAPALPQSEPLAPPKPARIKALPVSPVLATPGTDLPLHIYRTGRPAGETTPPGPGPLPQSSVSIPAGEQPAVRAVPLRLARPARRLRTQPKAIRPAIRAVSRSTAHSTVHPVLAVRPALRSRRQQAAPSAATRRVQSQSIGPLSRLAAHPVYRPAAPRDSAAPASTPSTLAMPLPTPPNTQPAPAAAAQSAAAAAVQPAREQAAASSGTLAPAPLAVPALRVSHPLLARTLRTRRVAPRLPVQTKIKPNKPGTAQPDQAHLPPSLLLTPAVVRLVTGELHAPIFAAPSPGEARPAASTGSAPTSPRVLDLPLRRALPGAAAAARAGAEPIQPGLKHRPSKPPRASRPAAALPMPVIRPVRAGIVQRELDTDTQPRAVTHSPSPTTSPQPPSLAAEPEKKPEQQPTRPDLNALAQQVYPLILHKLVIENDRSRRWR